MPDLGHLYLVPLITGMVYLLVKLALQQKMGNEKPFDNKWSNLLYNLSFVAPFSWFVDKREDEERKINHKIMQAGLSHLLNARTQQTLQASLLFLAVFIFALMMSSLESLINLGSFLVGMKAGASSIQPNIMTIIRIVILLICLLLPASVPFVVRHKTHQRNMTFLKDLPMLQMFIGLTLRSDATIEEMLYTLTTTETSYQELFKIAYRKYLRNQKEAFEFLHEEFDGTPIAETIQILESFNEYAKIDTVLAIENNQEQVIEDTTLAKEKANQFGNIMAGISFALPFIGLGLLGIAPIIHMVVQALGNAI